METEKGEAKPSDLTLPLMAKSYFPLLRKLRREKCAYLELKALNRNTDTRKVATEKRV